LGQEIAKGPMRTPANLPAVMLLRRHISLGNMGADTVSLDDNQSCEFRSVPSLAHKETVAVKRSKWLVITVLISAIVVATLIYYVASGDERDNFERDVRH
jgi:hypothetical protein